ncbi:hypothetical protein O9992_12115 [Vibrio lentus]|nr:hypothetical protein [Vibrio lentus]
MRLFLSSFYLNNLEGLSPVQKKHMELEERFIITRLWMRLRYKISEVESQWQLPEDDDPVYSAKPSQTNISG